MLHTTTRMSPWENGLAERHIGIAKDVLEKEILSQQISTLEDLDNLLATVQSSRNSSPIRRGFTPSQLVFGNTPNLPGELTRDPSCCTASDQEILIPPANRDMMGSQYVRNHEAPCRMQQQFAQKDMKDRILRPGRLRVRPEREYFRGQWVMLWKEYETATGRRKLPISRAMDWAWHCYTS